MTKNSIFKQSRRSLSATVLYHGTSSDFEQLAPQPNRRISAKTIEWRGEAIFATPDYRIALHYTANKSSISERLCLGVDLRTPQDKNDPVAYLILGGESLESAMDLLYGNRMDPNSCTGYIYHLDGSFFKKEVGLGANEKVTRSLNAVLLKEKVNRRELIDKYVKDGSIKLHWVNTAAPILTPSPK